MLARTATLLEAPHKRIAALITRSAAVCCDQTPLRAGPKTPKPGRKKAEKDLLVACTELYTHYLLGDRDLDTFKSKSFVLKDLTGPVIVHDRYQNYDCAELGELTHQLCCAHLSRDLDAAAQVYPDTAMAASDRAGAAFADPPRQPGPRRRPDRHQPQPARRADRRVQKRCACGTVRNHPPRRPAW
jgi:hypothetical protein